MKPRTATLLASALAALALTAYSGRVLDYRNMTVSGGKIYARNSDTPFSGKVTNVPFETAIGNTGPLAFIYRIADTTGIAYNPLCDISVSDGRLDGDVVCRDTRSADKTYELSFKKGRFYGDVKIYTSLSNGKPVVTATIGEKGIDGTVKTYRPKDHALTYKGGFSDGVNTAGEKYYPDSGKVQQTFLLDGNAQPKGTVVTYAEDGKKIKYSLFGYEGSHGDLPLNYNLYPETGKIQSCYLGIDSPTNDWRFSWDENGVITQTPDRLDTSTYGIFNTTFQPCKAHIPTGTPNADKVLASLDGLLTKSASTTVTPTPVSAAEVVVGAIKGEDRTDWPTESNPCTHSWEDAFRKENGNTAMINFEMEWEWVDNCRAGKLPH